MIAADGKYLLACVDGNVLRLRIDNEDLILDVSTGYVNADKANAALTSE